MQDHFTRTAADAGAFEAAHATDTDDGPTAIELSGEAYYDGPDTVETGGIRCAHCKARHASVADVRWCGDLATEQAAQARAEQAAEARVERHFEEGSEAFQAARQAEEDFERARAWNDPWLNREQAEDPPF
jgi:hypothetical protein